MYKVLSQCFPKLKDSYELWLTDTSHRTRRNLYRSFLVGNHTTVAIQYVINDIAVIGSIATLPEFRGKRYARNLIKYICNLLQNERLCVHLFAKEERLSFYRITSYNVCYTKLLRHQNGGPNGDQTSSCLPLGVASRVHSSRL